MDDLNTNANIRDIKLLQIRTAAIDAALAALQAEIDAINAFWIPQQVDATAGNVNINLPVTGMAFYVRVDNTANSALILPNAGQTIMGDVNYPLTMQRESARFLLIGTDWIKI